MPYSKMLRYGTCFYLPSTCLIHKWNEPHLPLLAAATSVHASRWREEAELACVAGYIPRRYIHERRPIFVLLMMRTPSPLRQISTAWSFCVDVVVWKSRPTPKMSSQQFSSGILSGDLLRSPTYNLVFKGALQVSRFTSLYLLWCARKMINLNDVLYTQVCVSVHIPVVWVWLHCAGHSVSCAQVTISTPS